MEDDVRQQGQAGPPVRVLADGLAVAAAWLLFAGSLHWHDLVAAALVGVLGAWGGAVLRRYVGHRPAGFAVWVRLLPGATVGMLRDSWTVSVALVDILRRRPARSEVREVPFEVGHDDGEAVTRRTVATFLTTLEPNSYVLGFDRDRDVAFVHVLVPTDRTVIDDALRCAVEDRS